VIVSDNGSTDGTISSVTEQFPFVKLLDNRENIGFAAGNNRALRLARGKYILLLNSDTLVLSKTLPEMLSFMDSRPNAGAATARVELPDGSLDLACHRGFPSPWNALCYFLGLEKIFPEVRIFSGYHQTYRDFNKPHEVDAISGAFFLVRRQVLEKVGFLDERFFMYAEDLDWCLRIKQAGFKIYYNPHAKIIHFKKQSGRKKTAAGQEDRQETRTIRVRSTGHFYSTMRLFYDKHYKDKYPSFLRHLIMAAIRFIEKYKQLRQR
jgi:hypothetical protein